MTKRVILYARLSVNRSDESVSIERQLSAGRKYAEARGWTVLGEITDLGVSATTHRPEHRPGWRQIIDHPGDLDAVVVWRIDRLARRVLDFLHADEALQARGAGIVAVEDPVDMTTPQGRAFATLLAVFGEMEAEAIRSRVKAAREVLVKAGRVVGGTIPYGWRSISNPDGPGLVLAQDPSRIEFVRTMVELALKGETLYSIVKRLDTNDAPLPSASQQRRKSDGWAYSTVERILRNPVLAGMTPYQPGRQRHEARDPTAVLRDELGLPVVDESVAIISAAEHRRLVALLDNRDTPQARPRASKGVTSPLLAGLAFCGHCKEQTMYRGTSQGRPALSCPRCHQTISRNQLDPYVVDRLLQERGRENIVEFIDITDDNSPALVEIEQAISDTTTQLANDDADEATLMDRLTGLKALRSAARQPHAPRRVHRWSSQTVWEAWAACEDDVERRAVLQGQLESVTIVRGKVGRRLDPARVQIAWVATPAPVTVDLRIGPTVTELVQQGFGAKRPT